MKPPIVKLLYFRLGQRCPECPQCPKTPFFRGGIQTAEPANKYTTIKLNELGTKFIQENIMDSEIGLMISNVPAHNGRVASKYIHDSTSVSNTLLLDLPSESMGEDLAHFI